MKQLLEVGTCGLRTVHNGFKHDGKASVGGRLTKYWEISIKSLISHLPEEEIMMRSIIYNSAPIAGLKIKLLLKEPLMYGMI